MCQVISILRVMVENYEFWCQVTKLKFKLIMDMLGDIDKNDDTDKKID